MIVMQNGKQIAGGGLGIFRMTRAEYNANKEAYDASDFLYDIIDEEPANIDGNDVMYVDDVSVNTAIRNLQIHIQGSNYPNIKHITASAWQNLPITSGTNMSGTLHYQKVGSKVILDGDLTAGATYAVIQLTTLPVGFRPLTIVTSIAFNNRDGKNNPCLIDTLGRVWVYSTTANGTFYVHLEFEAGA